MERLDSSCFNGGDEDLLFWFPQETGAQSGRPPSYDYNSVTPSWNGSYQSPSSQQPRYSSASRSTEQDVLVYNVSEGIVTPKDSSHQIKPRGSCFSDAAPDQLLPTDEVSIHFNQVEQQNQQSNVHGNAQYSVWPDTSRRYDAASSSITPPLIEHASKQQFHTFMSDEGINYEKQTEKRTNQHGNEEGEKKSCTLPFNGASNATYSWMKSKNADNNGGDIHQRRKRQSYSRQQLLECEKQFHTTPYISREILKGLARRIELSERQVKVWFQNRRMKQKKEKKDGYCQVMQSSSPLDIGYRRVRDLSSANSSNANASIEPDKSLTNVQRCCDAPSPSQPAPQHVQPIFHYQSQQQQSRHARTQLQPPITPTGSSQVMLSLQWQTGVSMQQIANEHNRHLPYVQPQQQQQQQRQQQEHAQNWQAQGVTHVQPQPVMAHAQSSFVQLQRQPTITQQLQHPLPRM